MWTRSPARSWSARRPSRAPTPPPAMTTCGVIPSRWRARLADSSAVAHMRDEENPQRARSTVGQACECRRPVPRSISATAPTGCGPVCWAPTTASCQRRASCSAWPRPAHPPARSRSPGSPDWSPARSRWPPGSTCRSARSATPNEPTCALRRASSAATRPASCVSSPASTSSGDCRRRWRPRSRRRCRAATRCERTSATSWASTRRGARSRFRRRGRRRFRSRPVRRSRCWPSR